VGRPLLAERPAPRTVKMRVEERRWVVKEERAEAWMGALGMGGSFQGEVSIELGRDNKGRVRVDAVTQVYLPAGRELTKGSLHDGIASPE
jgi:hypothetical protein